ncbi:hypothetical protein ABN028_27905 [Actinopolymorpha sp. B17G11]|uniref:hypothetical protein n=1 Tax=Actinopolymorpha sp. B17G11 TaxID=3160861 RepID=UPI0032E476F5
MPADFEREVTEHLSLLRGDVDQVSWRDETAVRAHGARRQLRRTATAGLAVVASVGAIGYGAVVGMPGDPVTLANPFLAASPSDADKAPAPSGRQGSRSASDTEDEPPSGWPFVPDPTAPRSHLPGDPGSAVPPTPGPEPHSTSPDVSPSETPAPTSSDTPTASPTPPEFTVRLLVGPEMPKVNDSSNTWSATGTSEDEGATPTSVCQSGDLASLGASAAVRRNFDWGTDGTVTGVNVVGAFASEADATAAYDTYTSWLGSCTWGTPHGPTDVTVSGGTASWWWFGHDNGDSTGEIEVVGLVRTGALLSVVVWHENGQDFIYDTDPMAPVLKASADRLAP